MMLCQTTLSALDSAFRNIASTWDGRTCITSMRTAGSTQWRQMEWPGFYFEYWCQVNLQAILKMPGPKYGNVTFDGFDCASNVPIDFKAHTTNSSSGSMMPVNDIIALQSSVASYGRTMLIVAIGNAVWDTSGAFKTWHDMLKGGQSNYVAQRIARGAPSRRRKAAFNLTSIDFFELSPAILDTQGRFQGGMRNSNGTPRTEKLCLNLGQITPNHSI